jgi:hypothetical protein
LPPDRYRVSVQVIAPTALAWTMLDPRLVLQSGVEVIPSAPIDTARDAGRVAVAYLVPAFSGSIDAAWSVMDPATGTLVRWRTTLHAPRSRADILRDALAIRISGSWASVSGDAQLMVELRNTGTVPITVTDDDVVLTQGERSLPIETVGAAGTRIEPGGVRSLTVPLPDVDVRQPILVRIGAARFRVRFS